ncbi:trypsin Inhibitor like cysteine rich domain protein [Ancylostoma duodenale]|uniref:Trypsin Inhibitor like cysteine rich domain protein n=1 Tax=Ancylostoma duodenale TaxID=51022 RepID=A0A0C2CV12_9BILA|nr:trypsin Inhibitor like cysteine rich domain protein [Ancylostoma duodenale]
MKSHSKIQIRQLLLLAVLFIAALAVRRCPRNEYWTACGTACEPKCNKPNPPVCTLQCIVDVCQCKLGYKRGPKGCVKRSRTCR